MYANSVVGKDHKSNLSYLQDTKSVQRKTKMFKSRQCRPSRTRIYFNEQEGIDFNVPNAEILLHNVCSPQKFSILIFKVYREEKNKNIIPGEKID